MSEIITNDNSNEYFDDNSLVEDDYYYRIKDIITCKSCNNIILNDPMMCNKCHLTLCKNNSCKHNTTAKIGNSHE